MIEITKARPDRIRKWGLFYLIPLVHQIQRCDLSKYLVSLS